jgi:hypothetical protein
MISYFVFIDVEIPDDGTDDPYDFKFIRWMCKEKVIILHRGIHYYYFKHLIVYDLLVVK